MGSGPSPGGRRVSGPRPAPRVPRAELTSPVRVRALLRRLALVPSKTLGQNFLIDRNILDIIVRAAELRASDRVLEIGPGLGVLTERLSAGAGHVVAVEKDARLHRHLVRTYGSRTGLALVHGDALRIGLHALLRAGVDKLVANLPYVVASRILAELFKSEMRPARIVVTIQEEVADRLAALPGTKSYGLLSVWAQAVYDVAVRQRISATCFYPAPNVRSAVVVMAALEPGRVLPERFHAMTKAAFARRRKQLAGTLPRANVIGALTPERVRAELERLGADPRARAEQLSSEQWQRLVRGLA